MMYSNYIAVYDASDGKPKTDKSEIAFDGSTQRSYSGNAANISNRKRESCNLFRPHNLLLDMGRPCAPFSVWLKGGLELQRHPSGQHTDGVQRTIIEGFETVQSKRCLRVRVDIFDRVNTNPAKSSLVSHP